MIAYGAAVTSLHPASDGCSIRLEGEAAPALKARLVVNAAGLGAAGLTHLIEGFDPACAAPSHYAKGSYFSLNGRAPFTRLIYPVPEPGGLGVHLTLDLGGQAKFASDLEVIPDPPDAG